MKINHVAGKNKGKVMLYALSTCGWCKKTKTFLKDISAEYDYIDVDSLDGKEKDEVMAVVKKWNPSCSFPTIVINNTACVVGFDEQKLNTELGK